MTRATACRICLDPVPKGDYHPKCLRTLFRTGKLPTVDLDLAKLQTAALAMVGRRTLSGVQRKISMSLSSDKTALRVDLEGSAYILKPQSDTFRQLPELELVSMRLSEAAGVPIAPCGLVDLADGSPAYIIRRFDRTDGGSKLRVEDFCQLGELPPKDKYEGSAELCVRIVRHYVSEPLIELSRLFRQLLVAWWIGNGDLHLKNLSLLVEPEGLIRLTPGYDMLSTRMVIPGDSLALPVSGKRENLKPESWMSLAGYAGIPERASRRIVRSVVDAATVAFGLIDRSPMEEETRDALRTLLVERIEVLRTIV